MEVILIGSTGATGKCLVEKLLKDNSISKIKLLNRRKVYGSKGKLAETVINFENLEDYIDEIKADVAISCLGTTLKAAGSKDAQWQVDVDFQFDFARLSKQNNIPVFSLVSSLGADPKSKMFYQKMKGSLEEKIKTLQFESLQVFRPPSLIRPNSNRMGEKFGVATLNFLNALGILKSLKPLAVEDLAQIMVEKLKSPKKGVEVFASQEIRDLKTNLGTLL